MAQPEKLTHDIELINQSGVIDPRLQTRELQLARRRAQSGREPAPPPARSPASKMRDNWRTFLSKGRR